MDSLYFDDYDFAPSSSSNLSSLFGTSSPNQGSPSLIYTAPKQPNNSNNNTPSQTAEPEHKSNVICAIVVVVWRLTDQKYTPLGTHGLAIIGSKQRHELILYKEKRNVILRINLNSDFQVILKKDHFATFYDSSLVNWLIKFNSAKDEEAIKHQIEMCNGKIDLEETKIVTNQAVAKPEQDEYSRNPTESETKAKSEILSRIAKMGQAMLPKAPNPASAGVSSDSDGESKTSDSSTKSTPSKTVSTYPEPAPRAQISTVGIQKYVQETSPVVYTNMMGAPPIPFDPLNLALTENRTQNTEIRMNLNQISEKLNQVLSLVSENSKSNSNPSEIPNYRSKMKVLELRQENLVTQIKQYEAEIARQDSVIRELQENDKQSNENGVAELDSEIQNYQVRLSSQLEDLRSKEDEINMKKLELDLALEELRKIKADNSILETEKRELETKIQCLEVDKAQDTKISPEDTVVETLKSSMNTMYNDIMSEFEENTSYSTSEIRHKVALKIKTATLSLINEFQNQ